MTPRRNLSFTPPRAVLISSVVAFIAIAGYSLYAALPLLEGPYLRVTMVTKPDGVTYIQGVAKRVSYLSVNGAEVPVAEDGSFSAERAYPVGYTAITIAARDRFGRNIARHLSAVTEPLLSNATSTYGAETNENRQ